MAGREGFVLLFWQLDMIISSPSPLLFPLPPLSAFLAVSNNVPQSTGWSHNLRWDNVGRIWSKVQVQAEADVWWLKVTSVLQEAAVKRHKKHKIRCTVEKRAVPLHTMSVPILNQHSLMFYFYFSLSDSSTCTGPWSSSLPITRSMVAMSNQEICSLQAPSVDLWVSTCTICLGLDDCNVYLFVCQFSVFKLDYITSLISKFSCGLFTLGVVAFPLSLLQLVCFMAGSRELWLHAWAVVEWI